MSSVSTFHLDLHPLGFLVRVLRGVRGAGGLSPGRRGRFERGDMVNCNYVSKMKKII